MSAIKNSIFILIVLIIISSCKETCYSCKTMCTKFEDTYLTYCLSDFKSEAEFTEAVDSTKNYLIVEKVYRQVNSFCESENDISLFTNRFGWDCIEQ